MNKKSVIIVLPIVAIVLILFYGLMQGRNDVEMVLSLPTGFISLKEAVISSNGTISYVFWENQISFLDSEGTCIYQTSVKDNSFIVKYKGNYYINERQYTELFE